MPTLAEIAALLNCPPPAGAGRTRITGIAAVDRASPDEIVVVGSELYVRRLASSRAAAAVVRRRLRLPQQWEARALRVDDPDQATVQILQLFAPPVPRPEPGVHPAAHVAASVSMGPRVAVGPLAVIDAGTRLGAGTIVHAGVIIGPDVVIGDDCELFPGVVIRERITLGNRVVIHAGSVLGTDGFGYRWDGKRHQKIPQIGTVIVEDDVEIGSCVCIDRAKFGATRIGSGSKIDNLVQIGHNVEIGSHCVIVGQAGLAGSSRLGGGVVLGGKTAVRDHVSIGDGAMTAACSAIAEDVEPGTVVSGMPALPHRQSLREQAALRRLPDLVVQVRKLQEEIAELRKLDPSDKDRPRAV